MCAEEHVCSQPYPTPSTKLLTYRCDLESSPIDYLNKGNHILCKTFSYVLCIHMQMRQYVIKYASNSHAIPEQKSEQK